MTIVLAYKPSQAGRAAAEFAIDEARTHQEQVVVVNASRGAAPVDTHLATPEQLADLELQLTAAGVPYVMEQKNRTEVLEAVLDAADTHQARLIVIGTRHRSSVGKFLLGSIAQQIILDAKVPVVAVKARRESRP